jgi:protein-disulfide isomerase
VGGASSTARNISEAVSLHLTERFPPINPDYHDYGGDGTRIDLAYAIYALSRGASEEQVKAAIRSRDLNHKGNDRRQDDYVDRTVKKALAAVVKNGASIER